MPQPYKYKPEYHDDWAWSLAKNGATDAEIAEAFGVNIRTIHRWKDDYPAFLERLSVGKQMADAKIEASLFKRAMGFEYEEKDTIIEFDRDGNQKPLKIRSVKRTVPPDTNAITYWLNNRSRRSGEWTCKQDTTINVNENLLAGIMASWDKGISETKEANEEKTGDKTEKNAKHD